MWLHGKIAPSVVGNFNIIINPKNTNVSVKYEIKLDSTQLTNKEIRISAIKETEQNNELIKTDESTYVGIMPLSQIKAGKVNNIQVTLTWNNSETNNEKDTIIGTSNNTNVSIPIEVTASQYLGEKIIPFEQK